MRRSTPDRLVKDYLKRLSVASRWLPRGDRRELRAQIEEHLRVALSADPGEAEVRTALDRLGDPQEIVTDQYGPPRARRGIGAQAVGAIVLLLLGGFLAGIGWLVGVVLLWTSRAWTTGEKVIGTLFIPGGLAAALYLSLALGTSTCSSFGGAGRPTVTRCTGATTTLDHVLLGTLLVFLVLAPFATAIFLALRARPMPA